MYVHVFVAALWDCMQQMTGKGGIMALLPI